MSALGRKFSIMAMLALVVGLSPVGAPSASTAPNEPPEGAKAFAERFFPGIVEEIIFTDRPGDWGFGEEKGAIAFSGLYPIHSLNADFVTGKSDDLFADRPPVWVAVIFQDGRPVNAIGARQADGGQFELDALGYPPELPHGLLNLKEGESVLHVPPADEYYIYAEHAGTLTKIGLASGTYSPGDPQTVEQFRNALKERYFRVDEQEKRLGLEAAILSAAVMIVLIAGAWVYFGRRSRAIR